jgi:hypothetical protein
MGQPRWVPTLCAVAFLIAAFTVGCDASGVDRKGTRSVDDAMQRCMSKLPGHTASGRPRGRTVKLRWSNKAHDFLCIYLDNGGHFVAARPVPR